MSKPAVCSIDREGKPTCGQEQYTHVLEGREVWFRTLSRQVESSWFWLRKVGFGTIWHLLDTNIAHGRGLASPQHDAGACLQRFLHVRAFSQLACKLFSASSSVEITSAHIPLH